MAKRKRRSPRPSLVEASHPPVVPGLLSPIRRVPAAIKRPPYALTGQPPPSSSSLVRTPEELSAMRRTGAAAAEILLRAGEAARPGVTTDEIDRLVHELSIEAGGYPSPLNYRGFPKSVCTSVNEVICHGIPDSRPLGDGDIVNIDVTLYREGVHGDTSATFLVGDVAAESIMLVEVTLESLDRAIAALGPGAMVRDIGRAIESHAMKHRLGVVREFIGHGVGTDFHSGLQIPHYHDRRLTIPLEYGTTFTIEPMLTLGSPDAAMWDDEWTAVTIDGSRTAQFEHTLVMGENGAERLTVTESGECAHDLVRAAVVSR
ncbi:MAG: type I methionyl aminopeptidase [Acidimicrobiaceae bacterium]|nr:type I methionyl aminopeptidase [Acidimicrobiaceae bacterium]MYD05553.1 type I methionyl aminopeptidase [Acidimicrobiaceae bacterium]MYI57579.1 type I methionyl aminopeptidase [Acidimicrobiaceae bacterium]